MQNGLQQLLELLQYAPVAHFADAVPFAHTGESGVKHGTGECNVEFAAIRKFTAARSIAALTSRGWTLL
jgi:hypothetical protein